MNSPVIEHPTLNSLADLFALHSDPTDVKKRLPALQERVGTGQLQLEDILILRSERGVDGTALIPTAGQVPVVPHLHPEVVPAAMTLLAQAILKKTGPGRMLVLQDDRAPLNADAMTAAGWTHDSTEYIYETDLSRTKHVLHTPALEGDAALLDDHRVQELLHALGRDPLEMHGSFRTGWTLVAFQDEDRVVALGAYGSSKPGFGGTDMIGVHPEARGRGLGARLHAHLLSRLAAGHARHGGMTAAGNKAMQRIFEKSGSQRVAVQMYFRSP